LRIDVDFSHLKDVRALSYGESLVDILSSHGFDIDKASSFEPVKNDFLPGDIAKWWKGTGDGGKNGELSSCDFLFKGNTPTATRFLGMAAWGVNMHPNLKAFNFVSLWFNVKKGHDFDKLVSLGNALFEWCEAEHGSINEVIDYSEEYDGRCGNIYKGLPGLRWINYFGSAYLSNPDFNLLDTCANVAHGTRLMLAETPYDEKLKDEAYVRTIKEHLGKQWFYSKDGEVKIPDFDRTAISRAFE
jgi:hypothetical protein